MKKKILVISLTVAVLAITIIGGTLAWFTDEQEATNTFTVGNVEIELREPLWDGVLFGGTAEKQPDDSTLGKNLAVNLVPGREIPKNPQVMNVGANPCYVRLVLTSTDISTAAMWNALITQVMQDKDTVWTWQVAADGSSVYFTYNSILNPQAETSAAFGSFKIDENATEKNVIDVFGADSSFDLVVTAQAIQSEGFDTAADAFNHW